MTINRRTMLGVFLALPLSLAWSAAPTPPKTVYDYSLVTLDGKEAPLSAYKGKVLLIVNLASKSIYQTQLQALEDLQKRYESQGLVILGIPSSDFGAQELADSAAIQHYYLDERHITFRVYSKASLRGKDSIPLVHFLTDPKEGAGGGDIHWNFTKFLVDRKGKPILRFEADSDPSDPEFLVKLEQILDGTYKKPGSADKATGNAAGGDESDDRE